MRSVPLIVCLVLSTISTSRSLELSDFVGGRGRNWNAINVLQTGDAELRAGNYQAARRDFDAAIRADPTLWVAIYWRAKLSAIEHKWQQVVTDCNEVLRQESTFVEAAILRGVAYSELGRHAAALHELNSVIALRPSRIEAFAWALERRAWLRATSPDASVRNARAAIDDAKKACGMSQWKDAGPIDTLATASASAGDFDSAVRYEQQAIQASRAGGLGKVLQHHLAIFQQHRQVTAR
jgi:tetratricopeptide (TPR) repeat protein